MPNFLLTVLLITSNKEKKDYNDNNAAPVEYPIDYKYVLSSSRLAVNFLSSNVSASDISHGTSVVSISTESMMDTSSLLQYVRTSLYRIIEESFVA